MIDLKDVAERAGGVASNLDATDTHVSSSLNQTGGTPWSGYGLGVRYGIERLLKQLELEGYRIVETKRIKRTVLGLLGSEHLNTELQDQLISIAESVGIEKVTADVLGYAKHHSITADTALYTLLQDPIWLSGLVPTAKTLELHAGREVEFDVNKYVLSPTQLHIGDHLVTTELKIERVPTGDLFLDVYVVSTHTEVLGYLKVKPKPTTAIFVVSESNEHHQYGANVVLTLSLT